MNKPSRFIIIFETHGDDIPVKLRSLTLRNFRSYTAENFAFHDRVNLIYGDNAQGKTNLLEAVHYLLTFRPFKQVKHEELISFGSSECRIKGEIESSAGLDEVHVLLSPEKRAIKLNGKLVYNSSKALGRYKAVTFLPSDIELVKGSPQSRRRYLDALICSLDPAHLADLKLYHRTLLQRNAVLSGPSGVSPRNLEVWDEKLAEAGSRVVSRRMEFVKKITPHLSRIYRLTSGSDTAAAMHYTCSFGLTDGIEESYKLALRAAYEKDRARGHTTFGPHRDAVSLSIGERDASVYASQGEAKNLALALKASEVDVTMSSTGKTPVLLLDDVTSELDEKRKGFLFRMLEGFPGQIFITATGLTEIKLPGEMRTFHIRGGRVAKKQVAG